MNLVFKSCILFVILNLENYSHAIRWKAFLNEISEAIDNDGVGFERRTVPKHWVIFFVDKTLRSNNQQDEQLKSNFNMYALEPYKSLQSMAQNNDLRPRSLKKETAINKDNSSEDLLGGLILTKTQKEALRKSWMHSCHKKAAKVCKKACYLTYKKVCRTYRCLSSQKRSFKRECARNCKMKFIE